jgi:hypothetical protein
MHYQTFRSVFDVHVFVLCYAGSFYERVPADVRKQGPWQGNRRGAVANLKPEYRLPAARDGYALVRCEHAVFKPEEWLFQEVTGRLECGRDAQLRQEVSPLWGNTAYGSSWPMRNRRPTVSSAFAIGTSSANSLVDLPSAASFSRICRSTSRNIIASFLGSLEARSLVVGPFGS